MDLVLPGTCGTEVRKIITGNAMLRSIPIIVLTASQDSADVQEGRSLGVTAYLVKPFNQQEMTCLVNDPMG